MSMVPVSSKHPSDLALAISSDDIDQGQSFDTLRSVEKPRIKLEVLTARQVNRIVKFNIIVWIIALVVVGFRAILLNTVLLLRKPVKMPTGVVKTLKWYPSSHWYLWFENIGSLLLCFVAYAVSIQFSIRVIRSRKKYAITPGQKMAMAMVISLAASMPPFSYIWNLHDFCWLDVDVMQPSTNVHEWGHTKWFRSVMSIIWAVRILTYSFSSLLYIWGAAHILSMRDGMKTRRERIRFYAPKLVPLIVYNLLRFYGFATAFIFPDILPLSTFFAMVQNFNTFGIWYTRIVVIVMAQTAFEIAFVIAIILRALSTMKVLRESNYIETRMRQVSFRFLLWSTILPYLVLYVYEIIDRTFRPDYFNLGVWLKGSQKGHAFTLTGMFGRDILLVSHAIVTAYVHLPVDSEGFNGWFKSSESQVENSGDLTDELRVISMSIQEDTDGEGPGSLKTLNSANIFVLPSHLSCFNFAWLAYEFHKENLRDILAIPPDAEFTVKCQIRHKETDTNMLLIDCVDRIILAFKGTTTMKNIVTDIKVVTAPLLSSFPTCEQARNELKQKPEWRRAKVHKGFNTAYSAVSQRVLDRLRELLAEGQKPIFCTGHSLGGALATLCSLDICMSLDVSSNNVVVSTFGSPRCGNSKWRTVYDQHVKAHWRFAIEGDIVTKLPKSFTYQHVGKQVLLTSGANLFLDPSGIEGALWSGELAGMKDHRKDAYKEYLNGFCAKYLPTYKPQIW